MKRILVRLSMVAVFVLAAVAAQAQTCTTPEATMISPTPGSVLPLGNVTFSWCNASADYFVTVESIPGAHDIFFAFTGGAGGGAGQNFLTLPVVTLPSASCAPAPPIQCIPALGETIHFILDTVKMKTLIGTHDYTYTAAGGGTSTGVWNGGTGAWSNALNWTGGVPNGPVNVFIDKGNVAASAVTLDMNAAVSNLSIDADDSLTFNNATTLALNGTSVSNLGNIFINSTGNPTGISLGAGQSVSLGGAGKVTLSETINNGGAFIGGGSGSTLINADNTIQGAGQIGQGGGLALVNQAKGIISASKNFGLSVNGLGGVSNAGTMKAMAGRTLTLSSAVTNTGSIVTMATNSKVQVTGSINNLGKFTVGAGGLIALTGPFSNFSATTLTGGTYAVTGTLQFPNANVVTNAATLVLSGTASKIIDQASSDGLRNLATNASSGSLTLQSGRLLSTPGAFSNAGKVLVGVGSGFGAGSSYTQTGAAAKTTVDGALSAPAGMTISAGQLFGKGTINATVVSSGAITPGDSATLPGQLSISGTYTQSAVGGLNISIGGLTAGTQYDRLAVTNGVSLNGKLTVKLIKSFVPAIGNSFTIVTGSAVSGTFASVKGLSINSGEHFHVDYGATSVTLTVVAGP
jgi:hypothetical protein